MGNALCGRLLRSVLDTGVTLRRRCEVTRIERESGASHILNLRSPQGSHTVRGKRGVIFAGGGFSANPHWREAHMLTNGNTAIDGTLPSSGASSVRSGGKA